MGPAHSLSKEASTSDFTAASPSLTARVQKPAERAQTHTLPTHGSAAHTQTPCAQADPDVHARAMSLPCTLILCIISVPCLISLTHPHTDTHRVCIPSSYTHRHSHRIYANIHSRPPTHPQINSPSTPQVLPLRAPTALHLESRPRCTLHRSRASFAQKCSDHLWLCQEGQGCSAEGSAWPEAILQLCMLPSLPPGRRGYGHAANTAVRLRDRVYRLGLVLWH